VKQALEGALFLFTGAEFLAVLAWRSCSIAWTKPLQVFVKVVEGSLISNFASDAKVQFSLENWRKVILKIESVKYIYTENAGARPGCDVVRGHVSHRRMRRTRFRRARRGAGVTAGHYAVPASTRVCRPWQVAGPRGADPPAGALPPACHWPPERHTSPAMPSASLRGLVAPARSYLPQPTFPSAYKPVPVVPRAHAFLPEPSPSAIAAAR
jgi:hypothetical protein